MITCQNCQGTRLNEIATSVKFGSMHIGQWVELPLNRLSESLAAAVDGLSLDLLEVAQPVISEINSRVDFLCQVGVGYLSLGRSVDTLSGGEHQRVRLATSLGTGLSNVMFVLDEPSIGLHASDSHRLIESFHRLKSNGNSVIVVDHDEEIMRAADHLVDLGPQAGRLGGEIVAQGSPQDVMNAHDSVTGAFLSGNQQVVGALGRRANPADQKISIRNARRHNLKEISVDLPLGVFVGVTGVSGSGKSTLVHEILVPAIRSQISKTNAWCHEFGVVETDAQLNAIQVVDQKPIGRSPRACPATYCGLLNPIRKLFAATKQAKQMGFGIARFSFNSKTGWCPDCRGLGVRKIDMGSLPGCTGEVRLLWRKTLQRADTSS